MFEVLQVPAVVIALLTVYNKNVLAAYSLYQRTVRIFFLANKAVNQLALFHSCPGPVQCVLSQFLKDRG